jgi:predicted lipoprotein with Yx(FWY)xxD motif
MPSFTPPHPARPQRTRRLVGGLVTLAATAVFALTATGSPASAATSASHAERPPVSLRVLSPGRNDTAGSAGAGFVVDLSLTARTTAANDLLSPAAGYKPLFNNPTAPGFAPGTDAGAPGLVVMLSTTPNLPGTPFQGPRTNLAGLFQINGVATVKGLAQTWNTWQVGKAAFGSGKATLTAYAVKGTAPAVVPDTGLQKISNTITVPFTISAPVTPPATPAAVNANATLKVARDARLGDILVDTTGRTLYLFEKDQGTMSACTGACTTTWPALRAGVLSTGAGLDPTRIGSANGQVTYDGHLLYFYAGDAKPGDTNGAVIPSWAAVAPTGNAIHGG